ncbi:MAG: molecular chaperone DnaJ [Endomicrobiales bacterium]|nr:molecular chaperone DnaJ [Endomicrobiales bacterium]
MKKDFYEVLGVQKGASADEIKAAYRKIALKNHPDKNPGNKEAEDKLKEANEAYEVLSDPKKKQMYDQFGHAGMGAAPPGAGGYGGFEGFGDFGDFSSVGDIFGDFIGDIFGGGGRRRSSRSARGADLRYDLELTLEQAAKGAEIPIDASRHEICSECNGSGAKPGTSTKVCPKCKGQGQVRFNQGFFSFAQTCPQCGGQGKVISSPCTVCRGTGQKKSSQSIKVRIPAGVDEGTSLRVAGAGDVPPKGGTPGDLYVVISLKEHPHFKRERDNLHTELKLNFPEAVFGGDFEVPAIDGKIKLKIPAGTQPGTVFRVRNEGFPHLGKRGKGDLLVKANVEVPKVLNEEQKAALRDFARASGIKENDSSNIFKKMFGG